jgi:hypothetical protein
MLLSPLKTYPTTTIELEGRNVRLQRIDVIMDFVDEEQRMELENLLHADAVKISSTRLQTHIYVRNARATANLFQEKYAYTRDVWEENQIPLPEPCTLSHNGRY